MLVLDTQNLAGATMTITNYQPGDAFNVPQPLPTGISVASNGAGVLTLTGSAPAASYQTALQSISFSTTSYSGVTRTVAFTDTDGSLTSAASTKQIAVVPLPADPWQNPTNPLDVNDDGEVTPIDALVVINYLNSNGEGPLPVNFTGPYYLDVNGDGSATPLDALAVINYLNTQAAAAESTVVASLAPAGGVFNTATPVAAARLDRSLAMGVSLGASAPPAVRGSSAPANPPAAAGPPVESRSGSVFARGGLNQSAADPLP